MIIREVLFLLTFCETAKRTIGVRAGSPLFLFTPPAHPRPTMSSLRGIRFALPWRRFAPGFAFGSRCRRWLGAGGKGAPHFEPGKASRGQAHMSASRWGPWGRERAGAGRLFFPCSAGSSVSVLLAACGTASAPNNCGRKHSPRGLTNFDTPSDVRTGVRRHRGGARQTGCGSRLHHLCKPLVHQLLFAFANDAAEVGERRSVLSFGEEV